MQTASIAEVLRGVNPRPRYRDASVYGERRLLLGPTSFTVTATRGQMMKSDVAKPWRGREDGRAVEFGEIWARQTPGRAFYAAQAQHALFDASSVYLDHSLTHSIVDGSAERVQSQERVSQEQCSAIARLASADLRHHRVEAVAYVACNYGSGTWGHWLVHNLPRVLLFLEAYPEGVVVVPSGYRGNRYRACGQCLDLAGVPTDRIVYAGHGELLEVDRAVVIDLPYLDALPHPVVFEQFRRLRAELERQPGAGAPASRRVYVSRSVPSREIANVEQLEGVLGDFSFETVDVGTLPLSDQARTWRGSAGILAVLGSDLTNMLLGVPERICSISPEWFGDKFFYWLAAGLGIEWNELVCGTVIKERQPLHGSSFAVEPELLRQFLHSVYGG